MSLKVRSLKVRSLVEVRCVGSDEALADKDNTFAAGIDFPFVVNNYDSISFGMQLFENIHDLHAAGGI